MRKESSQKSRIKKEPLNNPDNNKIQEENILQDKEKETEQSELLDEKIVLQEQLEQTKEQLLRTLAIVENNKKMANKEKDDLAQYVMSNFARDILSIADNLDRAIDSVKDIQNAPIDKLFDGIKITRTELDNTLQKHNIQKIKALDEKFDPNFHQAVFEVAEDNKDPGMIVQEIQTGYTIASRLLRPSMVGVSKKK